MCPLRYLVRHAWLLFFVVMLIHIMIAASRAQCVGGSCAPRVRYVAAPAPRVVYSWWWDGYRWVLVYSFR